MYIVIAILIFGIIIATHELGHFLAAKACGVKVLEFAIGMGPAIYKKQGKETLYALRLLPIGGFCAMEGEDEQSEDPRAFSRQSGIKKFFILVAGAGMNFILGLLLIFVLYAQIDSFIPPVLTDFAEGCPYVGEAGFLPGDEIYKIDGERVRSRSNFSLVLSRNSSEYHDIELIRDGEKVQLSKFHFVPVDYTQADGTVVQMYGITFGEQETGAIARLKYAWYQALDYGRMVRFALVDLIGGRVGMQDLSGPVGIVGAINDVGQSAESGAESAFMLTNLAAFIAINIGIMNLLPLPALDGGRVLFLAITWIIEKISRRKLNPKYEGYIHAAGLILLLGLSVIVMYNDIVRIISG